LKPLVIDIKTASAPLPEPHTILRLDPQLREYAWVTGIEDVAFLWFVKARPGLFKRGDAVTQLASGAEEVVMSAKGEDVYTLAPAEYEAFELECKGQSGRALELVKAPGSCRPRAAIGPPKARGSPGEIVSETGGCRLS
jgi:hypothetical protein